MGIIGGAVRTLAAAAWLAAGTAALRAADFSARELTEHLFRAEAGSAIDLSGRDLRDLDLAGIDFKRARLTGAKLFGSDLAGSDLSRTNLDGAALDRTIITRARFDGASLRGASLLRPSVHTALSSNDTVAGEAPSFVEADLEGAKIFGRFNYTSFRSANLSGATLAPFNSSGFIEHIFRTEMLGADFSAANLRDANLSYVLFRFANLTGADLRGANLSHADLAHANLEGADLTGADVSRTDFDGAILRGAKGLDTLKGLALARNRSKAIE